MAQRHFPRATPVTFMARHLAQTLITSIGVYLLFVILFLLLEGLAKNETRLAMLHIGAGTALIAFWLQGRWGKARYSSFGAVVILVHACFKMLAAIRVLIFGTGEERWPSAVSFPSDFMLVVLKGELISILGLLVLVAAWRFVVGSRIEETSFLRNIRVVGSKLPWALYLIGLLFEAGRRLLFLDYGPVSQIISIATGFSIAAIFLLSAQVSVSKRVMFALVLGLPFTLLAFGGGMKESIIFPLLPAGIIYWFSYRGVAPKVVALVVGLFAISLLQLYVGYVRDVSWYSDRQYSTTELVSGFAAKLSRQSVANGTESILARMDMTRAHAITVQIADTRGFVPEEIFAPIPATLIPRVFWPDKPVQRPGAMHTARILGSTDSSLSNITSASAAGLFTELYLGGYYGGVVMGAVAYGILLGVLQLWAGQRVGPFWGSGLSFLTAYWAIRFDELHVVYAFTGLFFVFVFIWLFSRVSTILGFSKTTHSIRA